MSLIQKIRKKLEFHLRFYIAKELKVLSEERLLQEAINRNLDKLSAGLTGRESDLTVSLTTFGVRIHDVFLTIESLAVQTVKPKRVVLWLSQEEFREEDLPLTLQRLKKRGLEVFYVEDLKSYKKLVPVLHEAPGNVITLDDDMYYRSDLIATFDYYRQVYPKNVLCLRGRSIRLGSKYETWKVKEGVTCRSKILPIGSRGVFYPINVLDSCILDMDIALKLAPTADDLWFKACTSSIGMESMVVKPLSSSFKDSFPLGSSSMSALATVNILGEENQHTIDRLVKHFKREVFTC